MSAEPRKPADEEPALASRAGLKLRHALEAFALPVAGMTCADFGCNAGGFTDVLLRAGAAKVFAVYGQLPSYRAMLDHEGAAGPADIAIVGSAAEVADRIASLAGDGVTDFAAVEFGATPDERADTRAALVSLLKKEPAGPAAEPISAARSACRRPCRRSRCPCRRPR